MKIKKVLAVLSAMTLSVSASAGYFPITSAGHSANASSTQFIPLDSSVAKAAEKTTSDGFKYTSDGTSVTITGYSGSKKSITIPEEIDEMPVTIIAENAFNGNTSLTSVDISESVTTIEQEAFYNCSNLSSVTLHEGIQNIDGYAFSKTAIKEIFIPLSLNNLSYKLGNGAFENCDHLTTVKFAKGIKTIPARLLKGCSGLKEITIPQTVNIIDYEAFYECKSLEKVSLSESLTTIAKRAFQGDISLKSIDIPESVTTIETNAFYFCTSLSSVTLHEGIQNIDGYAFSKTAIKEIFIPLSLNNSSYELGNGAFENCDQLTKVSFAKGIKTIPYHLFYGCTGLKEITIPDTVTAIADGAFYGCKSLEKVKLSESLITIPKSAFQGDISLKSIDIPESITTIETNAFYFCTSLSSVTLHEGIQNIDGYAFSKTAIKEIFIPSSLNNLSYKDGNGAFEGCSNLTHATIADGMINLPERFFRNASALTTVNIPSSVESFGQSAFQNCSKLTTINAEQDFINFSNQTFAGCNSFTDNRFTLFDTEKTGIFSNANIATTNGTVNYTIQYKFKDNVADDISGLKLKLTIPDGMTLLQDSFTFTDKKADFSGNDIILSEPEGSVTFTARIVENGNYSIAASMDFKHNNESWNHNIGSMKVNAPDIMINTADTTNKLSADVYGIAEKGKEVEIFVNDESAGTVTANAKTGKYSTTVKLPKGASGTVYSIYAKCDDKATDVINTTYQSDKPAVQNVTMYYNSDKQADITNVLTEGVSPIISFNPSKPLRFEIKVTNTDRIDRLFVTSEKGSELKYIEASYDKKKKIWIAEGYFDPNNHSYVPGGLNVSIIEKALDHVDENIFSADEYDTIDLPEEVKENSTFEVLEETDNSMLANITISNGTTSATYQHYTELADGIYIDCKYRTAAEVAKNPEKYGYRKVDFQSQSGDDVYSYYIRIVDPGDIHEDTVLKLKNASADALEFLSGTSILKKLEGESADSMAMKDQVSFANNYVAGQFIDMLKYQSEELLGADIYTGITKNLSFIKTTAGMFYDMQQVQDDPELQAAIVTMYLIKMFRSVGGEKALFSLCGATPPVSTVLSFLIGAGLDKMNEYINECIAGNQVFSFDGFLKFIIDPSGIVYEAVLDNPIEDATVTVYYKDSETGEAVVWDASDYDQFNPLLTDNSGKYLWDVPEGQWKVICEKDGYETAETDWMDIPPVRTDVNIGLVSKEAPVLISADLGNKGITVKFSKYMDISTVNSKSFTIEGFSGTYKVTPQPINEDDIYADTFILSGDFTEKCKSISVNGKALSYAGTAAKKSKVSLTDSRSSFGDANCDTQINLADAVLIMQALSNPDKYKLNAEGEKNADVDGSGDITNKDALLIQQFKLELIKDFPVNIK